MEILQTTSVILWNVLLGVSFASSEPNYGKFWHVTDFHYDHTYTTSRLSCNEKLGNLSPLGNQWCDAPWTLVTTAIDAMKSYQPNVDFLLWTGDTIAHISNDNMTVRVNMDVLSNLTRAMDKAFPDKTIFATFGNHDYYPASQFPAVNNIIYNQTADLWKKWIGDETQLRNFRKGGYYTRYLPGQSKLRLVALNTNLYYTSDKATRGIKDPTGQIHWLSYVLQRARNNSEKVILAAHIAPGIHTPRGVQWYQDAFLQPFNNVIRDFADVIKAMHFGHDHHDGFKVFYDNNGQPAVPLFVAPSVTPWRFKLADGLIGSPHNPSVRLVTYDRDTGHHVDIQQLRLDLGAALRQGAGNFTPLYTFTEHYNVRDISAQSLDGLVARMFSDAEGDQLLDDYFRFSLAGAEGETCDRKCKTSILCGFRHYRLAEFHKCTGGNSDNTNVGSRAVAHASAVIFVAAAISQLL